MQQNSQYQTPFLLERQLSVIKNKGDQKKISAWGVFKSPCHRYLPKGGGGGGAHYVSCQKRLRKIEFVFEGSIFKCQLWPALPKHPINV